MATERTYKCDLCRDRIWQDYNEKQPHTGRKGLGIHFRVAGPDSHQFEPRLLVQAEHHLCMSCLSGIEGLLRQVPPRPATPD